MEWLAGVLLVAFVIALMFIVSLSSDNGAKKNENNRLKDVIKSQNKLGERYGAVMDWVTKEKFNFYEMSKNARSPGDYIAIYNKLLEVNSEHVETTDPGSSRKPKL